FLKRIFGLGCELVAEDADVRKISVALGEIEAVADHEPVGNLEPDVAADDVVLASVGLRQQGADVERSGLASFEVPEEIGKREARVDDVLDNEDVAALDRDVEVLEDSH